MRLPISLEDVAGDAMLMQLSSSSGGLIVLPSTPVSVLMCLLPSKTVLSIQQHKKL